MFIGYYVTYAVYVRYPTIESVHVLSRDSSLHYFPPLRHSRTSLVHNPHACTLTSTLTCISYASRTLRPTRLSFPLPLTLTVPFSSSPTSQSGVELQGNDVEGVLCIKRPWPSSARTVYGDHDRFLSVYTRPYPGKSRLYQS